MGERDQDEVALEKILEAVELIIDMAHCRPAEAASLLERASYLRGLAEEIRRDCDRRLLGAA